MCSDSVLLFIEVFGLVIILIKVTKIHSLPNYITTKCVFQFVVIQFIMKVVVIL